MDCGSFFNLVKDKIKFEWNNFKSAVDHDIL